MVAVLAIVGLHRFIIRYHRLHGCLVLGRRLIFGGCSGTTSALLIGQIATLIVFGKRATAVLFMSPLLNCRRRRMLLIRLLIRCHGLAHLSRRHRRLTEHDYIRKHLVEATLLCTAGRIIQLARRPGLHAHLSMINLLGRRHTIVRVLLLGPRLLLILERRAGLTVAVAVAADGIQGRHARQLRRMSAARVGLSRHRRRAVVRLLVLHEALRARHHITLVIVVRLIRVLLAVLLGIILSARPVRMRLILPVRLL